MIKINFSLFQILNIKVTQSCDAATNLNTDVCDINLSFIKKSLKLIKKAFRFFRREI